MLETLGSTLVRRISHLWAARPASQIVLNNVRILSTATLLGRTSQTALALAEAVVVTPVEAAVDVVVVSRTFVAAAAVTLEEADVVEEEVDIEALMTTSGRVTEVVGCNTRSLDPPASAGFCSLWFAFC